MTAMYGRTFVGSPAPEARMSEIRALSGTRSGDRRNRGSGRKDGH